MSENYDQPDNLESLTAIVDQVFANRDVLIATIKQYFHARNEVVVLDKHSDQRKQTGSRPYGMPNSQSGRIFSKKKGLWTIGNTNLSHNHPVTNNLGGISTARALTIEEKAIVRDLASSGTGAAPHFSLPAGQNRKPMDHRKEIYNEKVVARTEFLDGRFPIQALYDEICSSDFIFNSMVDSNGCTKWYFSFCHKKSAEFARQFNIVFIMDCTYKTNRFGMPLLNIVGITATYKTFNAGFAFICNETEPIEGNHFVIKRILGIVNNDLLTVFNKIRLLLDTQFTELNTKMELEKSSLAHRHSLDFMKSLVKKISKHALDKMLDQYKKLADMDDSDECTGLFQTSIGVPCRHEIKRHIEENRRFNIDDIHCQWHLHAPPAVLPVAVRVEPFSSPRKNLMQSIKRRLYEADDDQVTCCHGTFE
ncbi:hypothetical protein BASA60_001364 [Batrachochytrium salamandrivorans]|nr:hypothetical protein BASA60_001364 [Batrachochytrium salamandrivorans]